MLTLAVGMVPLRVAFRPARTNICNTLPPVAGMHPVHAFTQSTAMRPFVGKMTAAEVQAFETAYDQALTLAYALLPDRSCLMAFRRAFFTLKV